MYRILVPTDFSTNSKGGMRFAMQWSAQQEAEIIFVHVYHPVSYPNWSEKDFELNAKRQEEQLRIKLNKFVENLYKSLRMKPGKHSCFVIRGLLSADIDIIEYCLKAGNIDFICMSTRGAGKIDKLYGTHTGTLITKSPVPVIAVPRHYRKTSIDNLLYASDFKNYANELKKVVAFARPLNATISVLHLSSEREKLRVDVRQQNEISSNFDPKISLQIKDKHTFQSLAKILQKENFKPKPSLIIMFTDQKRNMLKKLLSPSKTENLSFNTSIPLLAFQKD